MGEYLKGIMASLAAVLIVVLDFLTVVQVDTLPMVIGVIGAILTILIPNVRDGQNVRHVEK